MELLTVECKRSLLFYCKNKGDVKICSTGNYKKLCNAKS